MFVRFTQHYILVFKHRVCALRLHDAIYSNPVARVTLVSNSFSHNATVTMDAGVIAYNSKHSSDYNFVPEVICLVLQEVITSGN
jgi:hypothetical protein